MLTGAERFLRIAKKGLDQLSPGAFDVVEMSAEVEMIAKKQTEAGLTPTKETIAEELKSTGKDLLLDLFNYFVDENGLLKLRLEDILEATPQVIGLLESDEPLS